MAMFCEDRRFGERSERESENAVRQLVRGLSFVGSVDETDLVAFADRFASGRGLKKYGDALRGH